MGILGELQHQWKLIQVDSDFISFTNVWDPDPVESGYSLKGENPEFPIQNIQIFPSTDMWESRLSAHPSTEQHSQLIRQKCRGEPRCLPPSQTLTTQQSTERLCSCQNLKRTVISSKSVIHICMWWGYCPLE